MIQRKPAEEPAAEPEPTKDKAAAAGLIAEDEAKELQPGQMKKSVFLAELRKRVCATAEEALAGTIFSSVGCPWIDKWFSFYTARDAAHVETAIRKYAPEAAAAKSAREYIPAVAGRVRRGIETWSRTGEVTGVPPEMQGEAPSLTAGSLIGAAISGIGRMLFKGRNGDAPGSASPQSVAARLGPGHPLDGGVRARLGGALGADVTAARIHADGTAAELASDLNARAFTVGHHVAFAAGEYQPGTLVGDALIAHELAHVAQQQGAASSASYQSLEEEADTAAVGVVAASRGWKPAANSLSKSGLRLQRCGGAQKAAERKAACAAPDPKQWKTSVQAAQAEPDPDKQTALMTPLVKEALCPLGLEVNPAGKSNATQVDPKDYESDPVINVDARLNQKQSRPKTKGGPTRLLDKNAGFNFRADGTLYIVLGPHALNPNLPAATREIAEHELYLGHEYTAKTGKDAVSTANAEVDAWAHDFVGYFHLFGYKEPGRVGERYSGNLWNRFIEYYEAADAEPRAKAVKLVANYYRNPPSSGPEGGHPKHPTDPKGVQELFRLWLARDDHSSAALIVDLKKELKIAE